MTILFLNSSPKIPKSSIFGPKFKDFYFCTKLCNKTNSRIQISNMTKVFSSSTLKICKSGIFSPRFKDFILHQTLHLETFESVDFKYGNGFFKLMSKNTQIKQFLSYRVWPTECRCFFQTDCLPNRLDFEQTVFIKLYTRISRIFPIIWFFLTIICFE